MYFGVTKLLEETTQELYHCGLFNFIYTSCVFVTLLFLYPFYLCVYCCIPKEKRKVLNAFFDGSDAKAVMKQRGGLQKKISNDSDDESNGHELLNIADLARRTSSRLSNGADSKKKARKGS